MTRPDQMEVNRDGLRFTVGKNSDFSWAEMDALRIQIDRWNAFHPKNAPVKKASSEVLKAILEIKRVFPGALIENWSLRRGR